jgi:hypothetical protein
MRDHNHIGWRSCLTIERKRAVISVREVEWPSYMTRSITRRQALKTLATLATAATGAAVVGLYAWRIEPHWVEFTYPVLPVAGFPRELVGCSLALFVASRL